MSIAETTIISSKHSVFHFHDSISNSEDSYRRRGSVYINLFQVHKTAIRIETNQYCTEKLL